jgi:nitrogen regulatory protein P-II 1
MIHLVTAIIKPHKLGEVRDALRAEGALGMTVSEVQGFGRQGGKSETFRGAEYTLEFIPKVRVEVLVEGDSVDRMMEVLGDAARTGKIGDGKVWAVDVSRLMRVRTAELGAEAL